MRKAPVNRTKQLKKKYFAIGSPHEVHSPLILKYSKGIHFPQANPVYPAEQFEL
jgi:hypothetical protein